MKDNSGKILLAMLAGASAGVIAGLMMAPDTGEATRTSVKKWAGKVSKDLEKNLQTGLDEIKNMSNEAYAKVNETMKKDGANTTGTGHTSASTTGSTGSTTGTSATGASATGSTGSAAGSTGSNV
ncbi:YtxH domain-containing protein [Pontibacter sp. CAU 1760]